MRRLAVIPLALFFGCWDFDSLSGTYVQPVIDLSIPGDIACGKTPNTLQEDCTKNEDINNNCLVGCEDPTCYDHVACFASKGYKTYGAVADNAAACPGQSTQTPVFQTIMTPPNCNGSCSPTAATTTCTSMLRYYPTENDCKGKVTATEKTVNITTGTQCPVINMNVKDSWYSVDKLTPGTCAPRMATVNLMPSWGSSKVLCDQAASKLVRFSDMQKNGVQCVVFDGTDTSVCASTQIYTKGNVWYLGTNGSSTCTCSAAAAGGCALTNGNNNLLILTDKNNCGTTTVMTPIKQDGQCEQAKDAANMTFMAAAASTAIVAPTCSTTGAVSGAFTAKDGFTVCCM